MIRPGMPGVSIQSGKTHIAHVHALILPRLSLKGNLERLAHKTSAAIRSHEVLASNPLLAATASQDCRNDSLILMDPNEFCGALDLCAACLHQPSQCLLDAPLWDDECTCI